MNALRTLKRLAAATKRFSGKLKFVKFENFFTDNYRTNQRKSNVLVEKHIFGKAGNIVTPLQLHYKYCLIGLCTFSDLQNKPHRKKSNIFLNLMYIMLLKAYYSSFSVFTACMFDWLIDGRSLVKTKLNHLINSVCFRVWSITKTV